MAAVHDTTSTAACTVTLTAFPADRKVRVIKAIQGTTALRANDIKTLVQSLPARAILQRQGFEPQVQPPLHLAVDNTREVRS